MAHRSSPKRAAARGFAVGVEIVLFTPSDGELGVLLRRDVGAVYVEAVSCRRPTGAPPPLPKSIGFTGWLWLLVTFVVVGLASLWLHFSLSALHWADGFITDIVIDLRMGWLDGTTRFFNTTASTGGSQHARSQQVRTGVVIAKCSRCTWSSGAS